MIKEIRLLKERKFFKRENWWKFREGIKNNKDEKSREYWERDKIEKEEKFKIKGEKIERRMKNK